MITLYLTHPEVVIDPNIPTPRWGLSEKGVDRVQKAVERGLFDHITHIVASSEQKAIDGAEIIAAHLGIEPILDPMCDENNRTASGFIQSNQAFDAALDQLYNEPHQSSSGWETAIATQLRIIEAVQRHLVTARSANTLFVGHGTIGTLLKCHIGQRKISRDEDQRRMAAKGGGNIFAFDWDARQLKTDWVALEDWQKP